MGIHGDFFNSIRDVQSSVKLRTLTGVHGSAVCGLDISIWLHKMGKAADPAGYMLRQVCNLAGIDTATLPTVEWRLIRDLASRRVKFAWQAAKWPSICVIGQRTVTKSGGDEGNYIPYAAEDPPICDVFAVWNKSPKSNRDQVDLTWTLTENGVQIAENVATAWVWFRKEPPVWEGELYDVNTTYPANIQAYDPTQGNFYYATSSITGDGSDKSPSAQPGLWTFVDVPNIFMDYLIRGTYADYLRHNGELDRARVAESDARDTLDHELLKLHTQQGQTTQLDVLSY